MSDELDPAEDLKRVQAELERLVLDRVAGLWWKDRRDRWDELTRREAELLGGPGSEAP